MADVDVRRTVPARRVEDLDAENVGPGCMMLNSRHQGYLFACPGCAMHLSLPVSGPQAWTVTAGDVEHPETLTLSPSILHPVNGNGCGWHGYLTGGVFRSL